MTIGEWLGSVWTVHTASVDAGEACRMLAFSPEDDSGRVDVSLNFWVTMYLGLRGAGEEQRGPWPSVGSAWQSVGVTVILPQACKHVMGGFALGVEG